jgi:hypothetical protein
MNEKIRTWWRALTMTRHTAWLEAEVERLRAECAEARRQNWALVNSLVTTAGAPLPQEVLRQAETAAERGAAGERAARGERSGASARGRRSWHQVARALEIESARQFHREAQGKGE